MLQLLNFVPKNCFFSNILLFTQISYNNKHYLYQPYSVYIKNKYEEFKFNNNNIKINIEMCKLEKEHILKIHSNYNIIKNSSKYTISEKININISTTEISSNKNDFLFQNNIIINNINNVYYLKVLLDNNNPYIFLKNENGNTKIDINLDNHYNNDIKNIYTHYKNEINLLHQNQTIITG